jgi:hypothetical protein
MSHEVAGCHKEHDKDCEAHHNHNRSIICVRLDDKNTNFGNLCLDFVDLRSLGFSQQLN